MKCLKITFFVLALAAYITLCAAFTFRILESRNHSRARNFSSRNETGELSTPPTASPRIGSRVPRPPSSAFKPPVWNTTDLRKVWYLDPWRSVDRPPCELDDVWPFERPPQFSCNDDTSPARSTLLGHFTFFDHLHADHTHASGDADLFAALEKLQNPDDCATARYVYYYPRGTGFGSVMHGLGNALHIALMSNRTLLIHTGDIFARGCNCPAQHYCCYLVFGKCRGKLPQKAVSWWNKDQEMLFDTSVPIVAVKMGGWGPSLLANDLDAFHPALARHLRRFGVFWYRSRLSAYVLRPKPAIAARVQSKIKELVPTPCIALHIRQGDKGLESKLFNWSDYAVFVRNVSSSTGIRNVFLATESQVIVDSAMKETDLNYVWSTGHHRSIPTREQYYIQQTMIRNGTLSSAEEFFVAYINLMALAQCNVLVCTLSSNYGRLAAEMAYFSRADPLLYPSVVSLDAQPRPSKEGSEFPWNLGELER